MDERRTRRAELHAALGDATRLGVVDALIASDRAPSELAAQLDLPTNLLAHHLGILERVGLVERVVSAGDRRRRYVRLCAEALTELRLGPPRLGGVALFVCTQNSARSQLAAQLWQQLTGSEATSAGNHPADQVHPGAIAAGWRRGLDLEHLRPRRLEAGDLERAELVVSVCDRAHEEMDLPRHALHWSIPDPVASPAPDAFDQAAEFIERRILSLTTSAPV